VSVVVVLTLVGIQVVQTQHAGPESSRVDGSETGESNIAVSPPLSPTAVEPPSARQSTGGRNTRHVVQPGDTLQLIAMRNHLDPATLISVNELEGPDILQPDNITVELPLFIPRDSALVVATAGH
jgi:hypothetical protein